MCGGFLKLLAGGFEGVLIDECKKVMLVMIIPER
jgi:hypothetical protein